MLKSVNGFILEKYCRWSHTDKKKKKGQVYFCLQCISVWWWHLQMFLWGVFCRLFTMSHLTSKNGRHHVALYHLSISFCKVYILIMVMILSLAVSSLSVSVCHSRHSVWICFHIMDLCILLKICWIKISKLKVFCFRFFIENWRSFSSNE